jgi:dTDP-4-dehydrorhamnose 3,5-epimerase
MEIKELGIQGVFEITPKVFHDSRGYFFEAFNERAFRAAGLPYEFVQDNQSFSAKGVLRGLHFQKPPFAQGKLVRVLNGSIIDVVVDLRKGSDSFGKHLLIPLDSDKQNMVYVPVGFAHGFITLTESMVIYKCTSGYNKDADGGIRWNDPALGIDWGASNPVVSEKDAVLPYLKDVVNDLVF